MNRVTDLECYGRRWNIKLHGIPEAAKENIREEVICICQEVLPQDRDQLPAAIDIAHRVGSKRPNEPRPRAVIIRFVVRRSGKQCGKLQKTTHSFGIMVCTSLKT